MVMTEPERRQYYFARGKRQVELSQVATCADAVDAHAQLAEAYFLLAQGLSLDETKRRVAPPPREQLSQEARLSC